MAIAFSRNDWGARDVHIPQDSVVKTELAIHHTASPNHPASFWTPEKEKERMRGLEAFHITQKGFITIGYSWVVFPTARAYTGRGFNGLPAGQEFENSGTWALCYEGDFTGDNVEPTREARLKMQEFIERLLEFSDGRLRELGGHREFPGQSTECPGDGMMDVVRRNRERFNLRVPRN